MKPRSLAPYRPLRLTSNLRFILRAKDTESLFDVEATRRALRGKNIDLEAVLRPGLYRHVRPKPMGWKVGPDAVMRMMELRGRGLTYRRIAGELGLSEYTVWKYVNEG